MAFGDPLIGEPDIVTADDTLGFAGIAPPSLGPYPVVSKRLYAQGGSTPVESGWISLGAHRPVTSD